MRRMCEAATMDVDSRYFERLSRVGGWLEVPERMPLLRFRPLD